MVLVHRGHAGATPLTDAGGPVARRRGWNAFPSTACVEVSEVELLVVGEVFRPPPSGPNRFDRRIGARSRRPGSIVAVVSAWLSWEYALREGVDHSVGTCSRTHVDVHGTSLRYGRAGGSVGTAALCRPRDSP